MPDLRTFLRRRFEESGGEMTFEDFMAAALYDPGHGYYTTGIGEVGGRRGDFATSATLSGGLARAVAGWITAEINRLGWGGPVAVIELGGGNGALAAAVRDALGWRGRRRIRYHLVEVSPVLRELQRRRLGRSATWHAGVNEALAANGGRALIYSNEFVDAFPAKWLRWSGAEWEEIWVGLDPVAGLKESFRRFPALPGGAGFSAMGLENPHPGQRIEILPSFRSWLEELARSWREGSMLTIDYGEVSAAETYARRPGGTMRAYFRHGRIEGPGVYNRFGRQDLTSDVNFTDLVNWGERLGFETILLETQVAFLARFGVEGDLVPGESAGSAFRVLEQRR